MYKNRIVALISFLIMGAAAQAQGRYFTKTGTIQFYSKAALEDIEAKNKTVTAVLDAKTGALQFSAQMKGFEFEKQMMQQHFNDKYVESEKYPKAEFKGTVSNNAAVIYTKDGSYPVTVTGKLTLHGVTKDVSAPGTIKVGSGKLDAKSTFTIQLSDYNVAIPSMSKDKISNSISITVDTVLEPLQN